MTPLEKKVKKIFMSISTNKNGGLVLLGGKNDPQKGDSRLAEQIKFVL